MEQMEFIRMATDLRARLDVAREIVREAIPVADKVSSHAADSAAKAADSIRGALAWIERAIDGAL